MNKLFFLTLAALVACTVAQPFEAPDMDDDPSQMALFENDENECIGLQGEKKIFSDFCIQSRDEVKAFMKSALNDAASKVFNVMFNTIGEVTEDLSKIQAKAVAEGVELIKKSGIEDHSNEVQTKEQIEENIKENVEKVQQVKKGLLATIGDAVRSVLQAIIQTISSETSKRLALLKAQFNGENAREQIENACTTISTELKYNLHKKLQLTKKELAASATSQSESLKSIIEMAKLEDVGCTTTHRITMVSRFCDILITVGPVVYPLLGL